MKTPSVRVSPMHFVGLLETPGDTESFGVTGDHYMLFQGASLLVGECDNPKLAGQRNQKRIGGAPLLIFLSGIKLK